MTKLGITYNIIAGVLSLCTVGGTVAMCVPESQTAIADYTAENLSPKYQETVTLTKEQQSQINNLTFSVENLNSLLSDKQNQLNTANETIIQKDVVINENTTTITNLQNEKTQLESDIETLTNEKAQVQSQYEAGLITIQERDTTISSLNADIDAKQLALNQKDAQITSLQSENTTLQNEKTQLVNEKSQLQSQINTLQQEKSELQEEINTLQSEKTALENKFQYAEEYKSTIEEIGAVVGYNSNISYSGGTYSLSLSDFSLTESDVVESIVVRDLFDGTTQNIELSELSTFVFYPYHKLEITLKENNYCYGDFVDSMGNTISETYIVRSNNVITLVFSEINKEFFYDCNFSYLPKVVETPLDSLTGSYKALNEGDASMTENIVVLDLNSKTIGFDSIIFIHPDYLVTRISGLCPYTYDSTTDTIRTTFYYHNYVFQNAENCTFSTWVLNDSLTKPSFIPEDNYEPVTFDVSGTSFGEGFSQITFQDGGAFGLILKYDSHTIYRHEDGEGSYDIWTPSAKKTIVFAERPTGDLLTWLEANATEQV